MEKIYLKDIVWANKLSRDSLGRVFFYNGECFRAIKRVKENRIKRLMNCGLIDKLVREEMILPFEIASIELEDNLYGMILHTEKIRNVVEPTEWSFNMMLDAAKHMMRMERILLEFGYTFYDFHPYNMIICEGHIYHIDIGSIITTNGTLELQFATAMERKYFRPLYIWKKIGKRLSLFWLYDYEIGDVEWKLFNNGNQIEKVSSEKIEYLIDNLSGDFQHSSDHHQWDWSLYQSNFFDATGNVKASDRYKIISHYLEKYSIRTITELAANQGAFSQYCIESNIVDYSLAIDVDEGAIDMLYDRVKMKRLPINLGVVDLVSPISRDHYECYKRFKNEAVVAMALIHHLCLSQKVSMDSAIDLISEFGEEYIVIEFMPLGLWNGTGGLDVPYWWNINSFRCILNQKYNILEEERIETNRILFIGKKKGKESE